MLQLAFPSGGAKVIVGLAALLLLAAPTTATVGPQTTPIDLDAYTQILHVSTTTGNDTTGNGSAATPYATLTAALAAADATASTAIPIAAGTYPTHNLAVPPNTDLYGGFDPTSTDWTRDRDIHAHPTILDAQGEDRVLTISGSTGSTGTPGATGTPDAGNRIDGLRIQGGLANGPGGGILIDGASPVLTNNVFTGNSTLTPADWAPKYLHETAHDGGAIYCRNGGARRSGTT